tara:strand:+ start:250 stop:1059 length:810 start_codon:yes stop_codon:yes gene_type:complete
MKKIFLSILIIFFSCSKEDNSGLLDQISSLQAQNSSLRSEINTLQAQTAQIPQLQSQLDQAVANYENAQTDIAELTLQLNDIKYQYRIIALNIKKFFEDNSGFFWDNTYDIDNPDFFRGAYLYDIGTYTVGTQPEDAVAFYLTPTQVFYPKFKTYLWNGDCWVYMPELSLIDDGLSSQPKITQVSIFSDLHMLQIASYDVDAPSIGLTTGYDKVHVFTRLQTDGADYPELKFNRQVLESESYERIYLTSNTTPKPREYEPAVLADICPD